MTKPEIKKWNKKLKKQFSHVKFEEEGHKYTIEGDDRPVKSVSSLLKYFYEEFDTETKAIKWGAERNLSVEDVKLAWEGEGTKATTWGSKVHLIGENYVRWKFLGECERPVPICKQSLGCIQFIDDLPDYLIPICVEIPMYSRLHHYTGTFDGLLLNTKNNKVILYDYKGLPLNTPIFTSNGWKTIGELDINDKVFDKEGDLVGIKNISDIKHKKCIKFTFDNGEEIVSDFEHRWLINKGKSKRGKVFTSQEIFDYINDGRDMSQSFNTLRIFNPKPLVNDSVSLPIDPYVLGIWLGDGHSADSKVTQMNPRVWDEIEKRGYALGNDVSQGKSGKAQTRTIFKLRDKLKSLNLIKNKHIPDIYLLGTTEQRIDILRGFMDADGYYNKTRRRFVMATTKKNQVEWTVKLLGTLGIKSTVINKVAKCNGKKIDGWDVCFTINNFNPFLSRNQDIDLTSIKSTSSQYRKITKAETVESEPTICIEVDSPTHTFLFGHSFIVTHNTNQSLTSRYEKTLLYKINPERGLLQDSFGRYSLQLSFYQIILEEHGYEVQARILVHLEEDKKNKKLYKTYKTQDLTEEIKTWLETKEHLN